MRFIGDVHGKYSRYEKLISQVPESIQVGDMGVGFRHHGVSGHEHGSPCSNPSHRKMIANNARFIRGNHDNPNVCRNHSQWISDGKVEIIGNSKVMFVGGATSIDIHSRLENFSWWKNEELSNADLYQMVDIFAAEKPDVMITHECPESISEHLLNRTKINIQSATRQAFESMLSIHTPKLWIFGHWHVSFDQVIDNCRFRCLKVS